MNDVTDSKLQLEELRDRIEDIEDYVEVGEKFSLMIKYNPVSKKLGAICGAGEIRVYAEHQNLLDAIEDSFNLWEEYLRTGSLPE